VIYYNSDGPTDLHRPGAHAVDGVLAQVQAPARCGDRRGIRPAARDTGDFSAVDRALRRGEFFRLRLAQRQTFVEALVRRRPARPRYPEPAADGRADLADCRVRLG